MAKEVGWGPLDRTDVPLLVELAQRCAAVDGGVPEVSTEGFLRRRYLADGVRALGAVDTDGQLIAVGSVNPSEEFTDTVGMVDPDHRGLGLGRDLFEWVLSQQVQGTALRVRTESLNAAAERLYARYALTQTFAEDIMRHSLDEALPLVPYATQIKLDTWSDDTKGQFFEVYQAAFRDRPGFPDWTWEQWIDWMVDDEFRADTSLLASENDEAVAFITCTDDWIIQVGVRPDQRGRRLGAALVADVLARMRADGQTACWLDVNVNNPAAANLYRLLGFASVGQRATYVAAQ